jgi:hypothetical protein
LIAAAFVVQSEEWIMKTVLRHLGALALGYLAAGLTYIALPVILAPVASTSRTLLYGFVSVVALAVWIGVYIHFIRKWGPKTVAPAPPATPT